MEIACFHSTGNGRTLSDSVLYVPDGQKIYALNAQTGVIKWTFPYGTTFFTALKTYGDTVVTAASQLAPSSNNQLVLLNKNTGQFFWTVVVIDQPVVSPVMSDGKIYALTTNSTGTELNVAAYDLATRAQVWKKPIAAGFLMAGLPEMIIRGDTLITGAFGSAVTVLNKHTGTVYWSKGLNASQSFIINNEIAYHDQNRECVFKISLATGATNFQGESVRRLCVARRCI